METKHTPGPWKVVARNENFEIQTTDDKCLADAWSYDINSKGEEMEANAKMFAAAPELLEALEALVSRCESLGVDGIGPQKVAARAAIAKATA